MSKICAVVFLCIFSAISAAQDQAVKLVARTLSDRNFSVPDDLPGQVSLFIVGFTRASREQTSAWSRKIADEGHLDEAAAVYQAAVVEDVPRLLRGPVVAGIRRGVPESLHDRFLIITEGAQVWKEMASYSEPDAAYLLLLDPRGNVVWRGQGAFSDTLLLEIRAEIARLREAVDG